MTHDPEAGRKLYQIVRELGRDGLQAESPDAAITKFFPDTDMDAFMLEIVFEHAFRYFFMIGKEIYDSLCDATGDVPMRAFDEAMERFLRKKTRLEIDQRRRLRQNIKQAVLASNSVRPKRRTREKLLKRQAARNCYICGLEIRPDQEHSLDHRWPLSAGGGNGGNNLYRAHKHCDEIKADIAFVSDSAYGRMAYSQLPIFLEQPVDSDVCDTLLDSENSVTKLDNVRSAQMRIGVLQRQNHKCAECEQEFRDSGKATLSKRDLSDPWWFNNVEAVCAPCHKRRLEHA